MNNQIDNKAIKGDPSERPLVTLALFAYNQESYIRQAVESALKQDYAPLEIIMSDDCSDDATYTVIQELASAYQGPHSVRVNRMGSNVGLARHLNHVFDMAKGEIIVVAAGDDICFPNKVSALSQPMLDDKSVVGVHSDALVVDTNGKQLYQGGLQNPEHLADPYRIVVGSLGVVSQSHAFKKSVHDFFGPYGSDVTNEGKVMAFREATLGRLVYLKEPLTYYRIGSGVSTYRGADVDKLTLDEPRKIATWNYTAVKQIEKDSQLISALDSRLARLIRRKKSYLRKIFTINSTPLALFTLLSLVSSPSEFLSGLKAFFRKNAPRFVRMFYCRHILCRS